MAVADITLAQLDVKREAERFLSEVSGTESRKKKTLLDSEGLLMFLLYVRQDGYVPVHQVTEWITVQTIIGAVRMQAEDQTHLLAEGSVLALAGAVPHDVYGIEPSICLVTIARTPTSRSQA